MSGADSSNSDKGYDTHKTGTALVVATDETASAESTATATSWFGRMRDAASAIPGNRIALAAAAIGFIAGAGLLTAAGGAMGVGHLFALTMPGQSAAPAVSAETRALKHTVAKLESQISMLKANFEASTQRAKAQRAQITERYQHAARSQAEMQTRLAKVGETVDRLEKRFKAVVAAEATGSVAPHYAAAAAAKQPPATEAKPLAQRPIMRGWVIRSVFNGRAIVANRRGAFEAAPGLYVPGLGQIDAITRQGDRWIVVAERGIIRSAPHPRAAYEFEFR